MNLPAGFAITPEEKTKAFSFIMPGRTKRRLKYIADHQNASMTHLLLSIIDDFLAKQPCTGSRITKETSFGTAVNVDPNDPELQGVELPPDVI